MTKELGGSALGTKPRLTVASFSSGVARPTVSRANVRSKNRVVPLLSGPSTHRRRSLTSVPSGLAAVVPAEDRHVRRVRSRLRRAYVLLACLLGLVVLLTVVQESWLWTVDQAAHKAHSAEGGYGDGTPILLLVLVKQVSLPLPEGSRAWQTLSGQSVDEGVGSRCIVAKLMTALVDEGWRETKLMETFQHNSIHSRQDTALAASSGRISIGKSQYRDLCLCLSPDPLHQ